MAVTTYSPKPAAGVAVAEFHHHSIFRFLVGCVLYAAWAAAFARVSLRGRAIGTGFGVQR